MPEWGWIIIWVIVGLIALRFIILPFILFVVAIIFFRSQWKKMDNDFDERWKRIGSGRGRRY